MRMLMRPSNSDKSQIERYGPYAATYDIKRNRILTIITGAVLPSLQRETVHLPPLDVEMKKFNDRNQFEESLRLFHAYENKSDELPSPRSLAQALKACQRLENFQLGQKIIQKYSSETNLKDYHLLTSIIHLLIQSGDVYNAQRIFDDASHKSPGMYGAMLKGLVKNNLCKKAIDLFFTIPNPNEQMIVFFLNACAKLADKHSLNLAKEVLNKLNSNYKKNQFILCTAADMFLIANEIKSAAEYISKMPKSDIKYRMFMKISNLNNEPEKTFDFYDQMINDGFKPDRIAFLFLINAACRTGLESVCRSIVKKIPQHLLHNFSIQNALLDMWGKAGVINECEKLFQTLIQPDIISFTAMIHSYGLNGMGSQAIKLFHKIPSEILNDRTYVSVLNACSHSGLIVEAREIFRNIPVKHEYAVTAMVDCLSRAFLWNEATTIINEYEHLHTPSLPMYMSLLSGARNQRNSSLSKEIYERIETRFANCKQKLIPAAILLANTYRSSGDLEEATYIKKKLKDERGNKQQGISWTELNGKIYKFGAHDRSHAQALMIFNELQRIREELIQNGYRFDSSSNTRILMNDEDVESILCGHSEKLAIAFHFIQPAKPTMIQIAKNLRICRDCHESTKMICKIRRCTILIRDANRIHHFTPDGLCSCEDYF
ncbi:hypothetical protein I4U23_017519 [Adineta vaga]|nr:hypothetical protein I4U23_017519 [Adineta vaga]